MLREGSTSLVVASNENDLGKQFFSLFPYLQVPACLPGRYLQAVAPHWAGLVTGPACVWGTCDLAGGDWGSPVYI